MRNYVEWLEDYALKGACPNEMGAIDPKWCEYHCISLYPNRDCFKAAYEYYHEKEKANDNECDR